MILWEQFFAAIQLFLSFTSDGAMRRATIVVCSKSGTEVPRYRVRFSATNPCLPLSHNVPGRTFLSTGKEKK
jgi:hypothetical protein